MNTAQQAMSILGVMVLAAPMMLMAVLGITSLLDRKRSEKTIIRSVQVVISIGLGSMLAIFALMLIDGTRHLTVQLGDWVTIEHAHDHDAPHYHFSLKLIFDRLSVPFATLSFVLCGVISAFASRYMHRERGFNRFFMLFSFFVLGMVLTSLAGTIETLFIGWEMVGLSSALLVAFFQERPSPVRNGLRIWIVYRVSDAALLLAAVALHHLSGEGDFDRLLGTVPWPEGQVSITPLQDLVVGLLLLTAAAGKSALVPFSGWLPRAMEGPTPSSAVFYGALSVHLGAYLLMRVSPLIDASVWLEIAIVSLGLITALFATITARVQTDIKSVLCFASLAQVGLIVAEVGMGWHYIALIHMLGHACLRTLQFVRAPTLLQDYRSLENAIGGRLPTESRKGFPERFEGWVYRMALERGYLDALLQRYAVTPFLRLFQTLDGLDQRWSRFLAGNPNTQAKPKPLAKMEELS
jgi:NADH-quinone oxidoreductase subunit L